MVGSHSVARKSLLGIEFGTRELGALSAAEKSFLSSEKKGALCGTQFLFKRGKKKRPVRI